VISRVAPALASLLLAFVTLTGAPAAAQTATTLVFSSGPIGGSWVPLAASVADVVKKRFPEVALHVEPGAGLANIEKILQDKADLGWSMSALFFDARGGRGRWRGRQTARLLHVATFHPNVWHLVVPAAAGVARFPDLRGRPVALPQRANTSLEYGWEILLKLHGMTLDDLGPKSHGSFVENVERVKNRQAVATGWLVGVPAPFMLDLGSAIRLRLIGVSEELLEKMRLVNAGLVRYVIPRGTYAAQGIAEDVVTFQIPTTLIVSSRADADTIYKVTRAIVEGREAFAAVTGGMKGVSAAQMARSFGAPYHPGAERYYREAGLLKKSGG